MKISLVVAMSENRVIGRAGQLPWHLPADLKRFKQLTTGHPVILGRKTYESIGRLLPNRPNIIVTRQLSYQVPGATMAHSLEEAVKKAGEILKGGGTPENDPEAFIAGGADIYRQALALADRLYLTIVHTEIEGDAFFPEFDSEDFREVSREKVDGDPSFTFFKFERA